MKDTGSLSHTKWECKYHVVFIPKYRKKALYYELRQHLWELSSAHILKSPAEPEDVCCSKNVRSQCSQQKSRTWKEYSENGFTG